MVRSEPDGYNLLLWDDERIRDLAPYVYKPKPYDPIANLAPIVVLTEASTVLIASEKSGFWSLELTSRAGCQKRARTLYGSIGRDRQLPRTFLRRCFLSLLGVQLTHVPYRGGGPAMNDILGGQVDVFFEVITTAAPQIQSGRANGLFVSGSARSALLPDVPTATELGYPGLNSDVLEWARRRSRNPGYDRRYSEQGSKCRPPVGGDERSTDATRYRTLARRQRVLKSMAEQFNGAGRVGAFTGTSFQTA